MSFNYNLPMILFIHIFDWFGRNWKLRRIFFRLQMCVGKMQENFHFKNHCSGKTSSLLAPMLFMATKHVISTGWVRNTWDVGEWDSIIGNSFERLHTSLLKICIGRNKLMNGFEFTMWEWWRNRNVLSRRHNSIVKN